MHTARKGCRLSPVPAVGGLRLPHTLNCSYYNTLLANVNRESQFFCRFSQLFFKFLPKRRAVESFFHRNERIVYRFVDNFLRKIQFRFRR